MISWCRNSISWWHIIRFDGSSVSWSIIYTLSFPIILNENEKDVRIFCQTLAPLLRYSIWIDAWMKLKLYSKCLNHSHKLNAHCGVKRAWILNFSCEFCGNYARNARYKLIFLATVLIFIYSTSRSQWSTKRNLKFLNSCIAFRHLRLRTWKVVSQG